MKVDPTVEEWFVLPVCFARAMTSVSLSLLVWSAFPEKERSRSGLGARVLGAQWGRDSGRHLSINYCVMFTVHTHTHTHRHTRAHTRSDTHTDSHRDTHRHTHSEGGTSAVTTLMFTTHTQTHTHSFQNGTSCNMAGIH